MMKRRIFRAILGVALTVLLASLVLIVGVLHGYFQDRALRELSQATAYIAHSVENEGIQYLEGTLPETDRITWVAADGTVLFDNWENPETMDGHINREEIREAMQLGRGSAVRYSETLSQSTLYYALRLTDGSVLRLAATQYSVWMLVLQALQPVAAVMLLALCLALWLAGRLSRQLVEPINALDPGRLEDQEPYEELAPLVRKIRSQNQQIERQMKDLRRQRREFAALTEHMSEGLLVIDKETRVLSYNAAALRLLHADAPAETGESVLALNREAGFRRCVETVLAGRRCEELIERGDACCRLFANPVEQNGTLTGAVLIIMDVTEQERREALRREFAANVSHELKTPLTSISGFAEIMKDGFVRPEDIPQFAGKIFSESQRLIDLVGDIIKISQLDEDMLPFDREPVNLFALPQEIVSRLQERADRKGITIRLTGQQVMVNSVRQITDEVIYNLCDNAIKYNVQDGRVDIHIQMEQEQAVLTVRDTGIGISPDDQRRVFERFYRVDKSHSKQIGGTGLGLSIVKHGAAYLGIKVALESVVGKGSTFSLIWPKEIICPQDSAESKKGLETAAKM